MGDQVFVLGSLPGGPDMATFSTLPADAFGRRPLHFLNQPAAATMAVCWPSPAPFTEVLKPLKFISIWMERHLRGGRAGPGCARLVLIRAV